jgi:predicted nucleic acid-binding protein
VKYLVDTCVISELIKKRPAKEVVAWVREQDEISLFISVLTFGELEKGIAKVDNAKRRQTLRDWVDHDLKRRFAGRVLAFDYEAACRWGSITGEAEKEGSPIPVLDGQLAATALTHGLTFVTRNTSDVAPSNVPVLNPWEL